MGHVNSEKHNKYSWTHMDNSYPVLGTIMTFLSPGTSQMRHEVSGAMERNSTPSMSTVDNFISSASTVEQDISADSAISEYIKWTL